MAVTAQVHHDQVRQRMDGFGFCQAFQRANLLRGSEGLSPEQCREILDLFFRADVGAGLSILRLGIGSTTAGQEGPMRSIAPTDPGGPDKPLKYEWDGDDHGQVWLAQQAVRYGVRRFFANAWSAPGYMLHNGTDVGDGVVRGMPGTSPEDGDWRATYAEYLLQYVRFYRECGVEITDLGFANEPDLLLNMPDHVVHYALMRLEPHHVVDFVKVLGPAIERSGLPLSLVSCDAMTWQQQAAYTAAVEADPEAARWVDIHAGHNYRTRARWPLPTKRQTWMSEWDPDVNLRVGVWNDRWDSDRRCDGIRLAEDINDALTMAEVGGYLYWFGISTGPTRALIQADGTEYHVSKRFWAVAAYSRFIRPGAHRVDAELSGADTVKVSAFQNPDGGTIVNLLNLDTTPIDVGLDLGAAHPATLCTWLTDESHDLAATGTRPASTAVPLPPRSLTTVLLDTEPADRDRRPGPTR
ncbi:glycoside hydrolase family 30 beta sandwich domain-containing protein [Plantactinospora sp. WMMC1484]|uniref:glycoside hydrolase family 30 beta sandwich domain-containing protein n=1 Tax=Plantactinospora sp. WMMC1484 TaxID=3404122 RepID=UPI003BF58B35